MEEKTFDGAGAQTEKDPYPGSLKIRHRNIISEFRLCLDGLRDGLGARKVLVILSRLSCIFSGILPFSLV